MPRKTDDPNAPVRVRLELSPQEHTAFRLVAAAHGRSMSAHALALVRDAIASSPMSQVSNVANVATRHKTERKPRKQLTTKSEKLTD